MWCATFQQKINVLIIEGQKIWTQAGLNQGPLDLQCNAVPLSYIDMYNPVSESVIKVLLYYIIYNISTTKNVLVEGQKLRRYPDLNHRHFHVQ